jgi:hypothetical protein
MSDVEKAKKPAKKTTKEQAPAPVELPAVGSAAPVELPAVGSAARKAMILQGLIKE